MRLHVILYHCISWSKLLYIIVYTIAYDDGIYLYILVYHCISLYIMLCIYDGILL